MALKFPGSVVLQQNSEGHCCVSSPSLCTAKHVRKYFHTGELPPVGTVCEVDEKPLLGKVEESLYSIEEAEVLAAMTLLLHLRELRAVAICNIRKQLCHAREERERFVQGFANEVHHVAVCDYLRAFGARDWLGIIS